MGKIQTWVVKKFDWVSGLNPCTTMPGISEFTQSFFDASSKAWKKNKVRYGQAMYKYKTNAFPIDEGEPLQKQTQTSKKRTEKELEKRQAIDEPAPLRERRSPRLRMLHIQETYSSSEGAGFSADAHDCHHHR
jgi:hypothetical protein